MATSIIVEMCSTSYHDRFTWIKRVTTLMNPFFPYIKRKEKEKKGYNCIFNQFIFKQNVNENRQLQIDP